MYKFPNTDRGLRSRITAYKKGMQQERRAYGCISDGYGKRYIIFWLYFVLGDLKDANAYIRWYEKNFENDIGEPIHKLCCSLILHRLGKDQKAKYVLAKLMLLSLYVIPIVIGDEIANYGIRFGSNYADLDYAEEIPTEIIGAITNEDKEWMRSLYTSLEFRRYRKRYIEIHKELEITSGVEKRSPLVKEAGELLNELKQSCS